MRIKKKLFLLSILVSVLVSCKKDMPKTPVPLPVASFAVIGDNTLNNVITIGTYDHYQLINNSINADSYSWDFGNDSTSKQKTPFLAYPKAGSYMITLTVQNANGQNNTVKKNVKVLDRVVRQVVIKGLKQLIDYPLSQTPQSFNNSNVWVELKLSSNNIVNEYPQSLTCAFIP